MPLKFTLRQTTAIPVEVDGVTPEACQNLSVGQIERCAIQYGNQQVPLGEFFSIAGNPSDNVHVWEGNLSGVHWLGAGMSRGTIRVEGDVGRHVGSEMSGGQIDVTGNAGDWLGAEMHGGLIRVRGSAADAVGGAYRGSRRGMTGGTILVEGDAGHEIGHTMRRGLIAIAGRCGDFVGYNMLAGTVIVLGPSGHRPGAGMRRGTLAFLSTDRPVTLPTFRHACTYRPVTMTVLLRELRAHAFPVPGNVESQSYDLYHGDLITGGRGELLLVA